MVPSLHRIRSASRFSYQAHRIPNQRLADETREVRNLMSQIILANLDGWGEEYEQIRQDAGIE